MALWAPTVNLWEGRDVCFSTALHFSRETALADSPALLEEICLLMSGAIAPEAGNSVLPEHVDVSVVAGSFDLRITVRGTPEVPAPVVLEVLTSIEDLPARVVAAVSAVVGAEAKDEAVSVVSMEAPEAKDAPGWSHAVDPDSGLTYYINDAAGTTQWEVPEESPSVSFRMTLRSSKFPEKHGLPGLPAALEAALKKVIVSEAAALLEGGGILQENVDVVIVSGTVAMQASIHAPPGVRTHVIHATLNAAAASLPQTLAAALGADGTIRLGEVGAPTVHVRGYDLYRVYTDEPKVAGWRENRDGVWGRRVWTHVGMRMTTKSFTEIVRMNGIEEFLVIGEWSLFTVVPEDTSAYEDLEWTLDLFENVDDEKPSGSFQRGQVAVGLGMPFPGIVELLLPDEREVVITRFAKYRFPPWGGLRLLQQLPCREHNDDVLHMGAITSPHWTVLPAPSPAAAESASEDSPAGVGETALLPDSRARQVLPVTSGRDPRSQVIGYLNEGELVQLAVIVGTRARLARLVDGTKPELSGGWFPFLRLNAAPTLQRILEPTANMIEQAQFSAYLKEMDEQAEEDFIPLAETKREIPKVAPLIVHVKELPSVDRDIKRQKKPMGSWAQRPTVTGGWRMFYDEVWDRPTFVEPISGSITWAISDVMSSGGLDDLLLSRSWEICVVDPLAIEVMKDKDWTFDVFAHPSCTGEPVESRRKGELFIAMRFLPRLGVVSVLMPPTVEGGAWGSGYAEYVLRDGRQLVRSLLAPVEEGVPPLEAPEGEVLEGPYFSRPPDAAPEILVSTEQDLQSPAMARLPRDYRVGGFDTVLGMRARLQQLEGGGWISLFRQDGTPCLWRLPSKPPVLPDDVKAGRYVSKQVVVRAVQEERIEERPLNELLQRFSSGRSLCDWNRTPLPPSGKYVYKSPVTFSHTTLDDLLRLGVWKAAVVTVESLPVREGPQYDARQVDTLPCGSLVVAEWVTPLSVVRILLPRKPDDPSPAHVFADMGGPDGSAVIPMAEGGDFWVEPHGGHLPEERQRDEDMHRPMPLHVRVDFEPASREDGSLHRGDGVQMAEVRGRRARVVQTTYITGKPTAPRGGWMDVFDESGWSFLKRRLPGEVHIVEEMLAAWKNADAGLPDEDPEAARKNSKLFHLSRISRLTGRSMPSGASGIGEIDDIASATSEGVRELPLLLQQLGELEAASVLTRDWREHRDPVWGRRYFVNRWSGQVIHRLVSMGVARPMVRLTIWIANLTLSECERGLGNRAAARIKDLENSLRAPFLAMADVPDDLLELQFKDGPGADDSDGGLSSRSSVDSITGVPRGPTAAERQEPQLRIVATMTAPGVHAHWASAGLKRAMADGERFANSVIATVSRIPLITCLQPGGAQGEPIAFLRADLEEFDMPRLPPFAEPVVVPEPPLVPPPDEQVKKLRTQLRYSRPKVLEHPYMNFAGGNGHALAEGLTNALEGGGPHLLELHLWCCSLSDEGAVAIARALHAGTGVMLHTVLLDENGIGALGATALGTGFKSCGKIREVNMSRNPIKSSGLRALTEGLGAEMVLFDVWETELDDKAIRSTAAALRRWPAATTLKLGGNPGITDKGVEMMARAMMAMPTLKFVDLKGSTLGDMELSLRRMLENGGVDTSRMRL